MKRCRFGAGLLIGILVIGLLATFWTGRRCDRLAREIQLAGEAAVALDWEAAEALTRKVYGHWKTAWPLFAALTDHAPMEQIDALFVRLDIYARAEDHLSYSVICARLSREIDAIAEAQIPSWWNLL